MKNRKRLFSAVLSFFLICFCAEADYYRFDPHKGSFSKELSLYLTLSLMKEGCKFTKLKKEESSQSSSELLNHLVKIKNGEWRVLGPERSRKN